MKCGLFLFFFFFAFWAKLIDHHKMRLACEIFLKQSKLTGPPNLHSFPEVKRISIKWIDSIPSRTLFNKNYIWKSRGKLCTLKNLKNSDLTDHSGIDNCTLDFTSLLDLTWHTLCGFVIEHISLQKRDNIHACFYRVRINFPNVILYIIVSWEGFYYLMCLISLCFRSVFWPYGIRLKF